MSELTPTSVAAALDISVPYASQLLSGDRDMPRGIAIKLFRATGAKLGPIANATDDEIETLEAFPERAKVIRARAA